MCNAPVLRNPLYLFFPLPSVAQREQQPGSSGKRSKRLAPLLGVQNPTPGCSPPSKPKTTTNGHSVSSGRGKRCITNAMWHTAACTWTAGEGSKWTFGTSSPAEQWPPGRGSLWNGDSAQCPPHPTSPCEKGDSSPASRQCEATGATESEAAWCFSWSAGPRSHHTNLARGTGHGPGQPVGLRPFVESAASGTSLRSDCQAQTLHESEGLDTSHNP